MAGMMKYTFSTECYNSTSKSQVVSPLSPRHHATSGCGSRRRPPNMEDSWEYTEWTDAESRQGVVLQLWG